MAAWGLWTQITWRRKGGGAGRSRSELWQPPYFSSSDATIKTGSRKSVKTAIVPWLWLLPTKSQFLVDSSTEKGLRSAINSAFRLFTNSQSLLVNISWKWKIAVYKVNDENGREGRERKVRELKLPFFPRVKMLAAAGSFPRVYLIFTPFIGPWAKSLGQREDGCGGTWLAWLIPFWKGLKGASSRDLNSGNSPFSLLRMPPFASLSVGTRGTAGHLAAPHLSSTSLQLWHPAPPPPVPLHGGQACQWQRQQRWARGRTHPQGPSMLCLFLFPVAEEWAINVMICFPWRKWHLPFPDPAVDVEGEPVQAFFRRDGS